MNHPLRMLRPLSGPTRSKLEEDVAKIDREIAELRATVATKHDVAAIKSHIDARSQEIKGHIDTRTNEVLEAIRCTRKNDSASV